MPKIPPIILFLPYNTSQSWALEYRKVAVRELPGQRETRNQHMGEYKQHLTVLHLIPRHFWSVSNLSFFQYMNIAIIYLRHEVRWTSPKQNTTCAHLPPRSNRLMLSQLVFHNGMSRVWFSQLPQIIFLGLRYIRNNWNRIYFKYNYAVLVLNRRLNEALNAFQSRCRRKDVVTIRYGSINITLPYLLWNCAPQ